MPIVINSSENIILQLAKVVKNEKYECIMLPTHYSCLEFRKNYLRLFNLSEADYMPEIVSISDIVHIDEERLTCLLIHVLRKHTQLGRAFELAQSLTLFIKELILNNIDHNAINSLIPEAFSEHFYHVTNILKIIFSDTLMQSEIANSKNTILSFQKNVKNKKILLAGIISINRRTNDLLKNVRSNAKHCEDVTINSDYDQSSNIIEYFEGKNIVDESRAVTLTIKKAIADNKSVLLIADDNLFMDYLKIELVKWNIHSDFFTNCCFLRTKEGVFFAAMIDMISKEFQTEQCLNFFKMSDVFLDLANAAELIFRKKQYVPANIFDAIELLDLDNFNPLVIAIKQIMVISDNLHHVSSFFEKISCITQIAHVLHYEVNDLYELARSASLNYELLPHMSFGDFVFFLQENLFKKLLKIQTKSAKHVTIVNVLDAQLLHADVVILANANESVWRSSCNFDLWMSKAILSNLSINTTKRQDDFLHMIFERLISKKNVLITRAIMRGDTTQEKYKHPALLLLESNLSEAIWLKHIIRALENNIKINKISFDAPRPLSQYIPKKFSITDVDVLQSNPYEFYAKKILRLKEMHFINEYKNLKGIFVHEILDIFTKNGKQCTARELASIAENILKQKNIPKSALGLWLYGIDDTFTFIAYNFLTKCANFSEVSGSVSIPLSDSQIVEICCKADLLRLDADSSVTIIDYKTNKPPSKKQILDCKKMQLPLEAIIGRNGGFDICSSKVQYLQFWQLTPRENHIIEIARSFEEMDELCSRTIASVTDLLNQYIVHRKAFNINVNALNKNYLHLSRIKEWQNA